MDPGPISRRRVLAGAGAATLMALHDGLGRAAFAGEAAPGKTGLADGRIARLQLQTAAPLDRMGQFYGDLLFALSLPVDVFDLSQSGRFADLIRHEGVPVYG